MPDPITIGVGLLIDVSAAIGITMYHILQSINIRIHIPTYI